MKNRIVITVGGRDRVGVVKTLSNIVLQNEGNLEKSRMARLGGEFTGILMATVDEDHLDSLMEQLNNLDKIGLNVFVRLVTQETYDRLRGYVPHEIVAKGPDHEGILSAFADELAGAGVNIEELTTEVVHAPNTGASLFTLHALVVSPREMSTRDLRERLQGIADNLGLDIEVKLGMG